MKKLLYIAALLTVICSCDDKLDITPRDFVNTDGLFSNDPNILLGAINSIFDEWFDRGRNIDNWGPWEHVGTDLGTYDEYRYERKDNTELYCYYDNRMNPEAQAINRLWNFEYRIVNKAARIIQSGKDEAIINDPVAQRAVSEAKFFWCLAYYELFMNFGDVPMLIDPVDGPRDDFERTPVEEIIPVIEQYLLEAIEVLDENTSDARVSKNACRMLLAKVYMAAAGDVYQQPGEVAGPESAYWSKAEEIAEDIIESGTFQLIKEKSGPHANDNDTVKGPVNWNIAGFPGIREGMQQKYMVRHSNYFSCLFQNDFEGPEQGNTETIFRIAFNGQDDNYGRNYIRLIWMPYIARANGITRDLYQGGRTWGRTKMTDYMCYDIWDYQDHKRGENYDLRKHGTYKYHYYFNDEGALKNSFLYVRRFTDPNNAVDSLYGWRELTAESPASRTGVTGTIVVGDKINWGNNGEKYFTADYLVVNDDSVFVQPIITNYAGAPGNSKWGIPYYEEWFPKRVYYQGDTIWGPRPGDEFFPRSQQDWQSAAIGCTKHSYWVRNTEGTAISQSEVDAFVKSSGGPGDIILFRYAEAYLIAGEAEFHQNKLQEASDHFNEVRKRAFNNGDVPVKWQIEPNEITIDWILDERGRELFTEEYRWFEIKRLKKWDRVMNYNILAKNNFQYSKHRLRPVPLLVIEVNKGNPEGMYQNPEYN
ncbi:MAG: RagB/SusD family nutrient uptake outer membrane protein [Bacteroidales bacterium]|nr:RagB/SusD family nutrient uptake outer membrane protein [Bacteroidales bacterium]